METKPDRQGSIDRLIPEQQGQTFAQVFVRSFLREVTKWTTLVDVFDVLSRTRAHYPASPLFARRQRRVFYKEKMNLLDFLFPRRCLTCWHFGTYFCDRCAATIRIVEERETICPICEHPSIGGITHAGCQGPYRLDGLTSFFHYDGIVREAVKVLKYRRVTDLAEEFTSLIPPDTFDQLSFVCHPGSSLSHSRESGNPVFVPIPLHGSRFRDRGFNQAEVFGKLIAARLNVPFYTDILRRVKKTIPQVEMKNRKERMKNMRGVFAIHNSPFSIPHSCILFDDVFTTGATMRAAGESLKRAGARFVWAVTMAR